MGPVLLCAGIACKVSRVADLYSLTKGKSVRIQSMCTATLCCFLGAVLVAVPPRLAFSDEISDRLVMARAIAHHIMGSTCALYGLTAQAVGEYQEALRYDPSSYLTHLRLGAHYARMGKFDDAIEQLVLTEKLNPEDIKSRYLLALIYSTQKNFDKAAEEYEVILKSLTDESPGSVDLYFYLGQLYYAQREYEKAIVQFKKVLELHPQNAELLGFLGALYVEMDREDEAIEIFKKVLELDSNNDAALNSLGYIYAERGSNLEEAMKLVSRALAIVPDSAAYLDSLGWVHYKQGKYQEALKFLLKADGKMHDPVIFDHIGDVYLALKQLSEAKKYWMKSIELNPDQKNILEKIERVEKNQEVLAGQNQ
jgi:tetratricopeptide (TPR) repeat protein